MSFSAYEVFSIITGILLVLCAAMPDLTVRDRAAAVLTGSAFVAYGLYVASRTTGTYEFPVFVFVFPFAVLAYLGYKLVTRGDSSAHRSRPATGSTAHVSSTGPVPTTFAGIHAPPGSSERRCTNRDCDSYGKSTRRVDCLRCEQPTAAVRPQGLGATTPVPVRRFAHLETRCCTATDCAERLVRTADLVCRRCRTDTASVEAARA